MRPGRRGAGDRLRRTARRDVRRLRPGHRPGDGDPGGLPGPRARPRAGQRAARRVRAGRVRRLAPAAARVRAAAAAGRARLRDRLRRVRVPARARDQLGHRQHGRHVPRALDYLGRGLPARRGSPRARQQVRQPGAGRHLRADPPRGRGGRRRPRRAARGGAPRLVRRVRRRGDRPVRDHRGDGRHGGAAPRLPHRAGHGHLARAPGGAGHLRLPGADRVQDRPLGPGPGLPPAARPAVRLRPGRDDAGQRRVHPHGHRVRQARLRRPGGVVRRPGLHGRAARRFALGHLQRRAPQARRRHCERGAAAGPARGENRSCRNSPRPRSG